MRKPECEALIEDMFDLSSLVTDYLEFKKKKESEEQAAGKISSLFNDNDMDNIFFEDAILQKKSTPTSLMKYVQS